MQGVCLVQKGGAVYDKNGSLLGIVAPALMRKDGSYLELGAIISAKLLFREINMKFAETQKVCSSFSGVNVRGPSTAKAVAIGTKSLVRVRVGDSWGSGIVVSKHGHVVTCAHLVLPFTAMDTDTNLLRLSPYFSNKIYIEHMDENNGVNWKCEADLVHCSNGTVDCAFLRLKESTMNPVQAWDKLCPSILCKDFEDEMLVLGQNVVSLGYAIFEPKSDFPALASSGNLCRVVNGEHAPYQPIMLQSSACVFRGQSGGMLLDLEGRCLGMLTSNAKHADGNIIPVINFILPWVAMEPALGSILVDQELNYESVTEACRSLDVKDKALEQLWRLESQGCPAPPCHKTSSVPLQSRL